MSAVSGKTTSRSMRRLVGLIPAGGLATRIAPLPCSKELLPVGWHRDGPEHRARPKVVSQYLLDKMRAAGTREVYWILRRGKWDIIDYFGDGSGWGMRFAYLVMGAPYGPPFTLDQAFAFVDDATIVFGFPDILLEPDDVFVRLLHGLHSSGADVVLATFDPARSEATDVLEVAPGDRVTRLVVKELAPRGTEVQCTWMCAVWQPSFTRFLHEEVSRLGERARAAERGTTLEWPVGVVIQSAIDAGLHVHRVHFGAHRYLDIGTPKGLIAAADFLKATSPGDDAG
jgi:glucose-1-phosphate thymidylyltransferase